MFNFSFFKNPFVIAGLISGFCFATIGFTEESKTKVEVFLLPPKTVEAANDKIPPGIAAETWESDIAFDKVFNTRKQLPQLAQYRVNATQQANHWRICCDNAIRSARYQAEDGCISERQEVWRVASIPLTDDVSSLTPDDVVQRMLQSEYKGLRQVDLEEIMSWCKTTLNKDPLSRELQNENGKTTTAQKKMSCQASAVAFCYKE